MASIVIEKLESMECGPAPEDASEMSFRLELRLAYG
jgi:hypothetical protein